MLKRLVQKVCALKCRVVVLALSITLGYLGIIAACVKICPGMDYDRLRAVNAAWPDDGPRFSSHFATWDGAHYLQLASKGYTPESESTVFFPLYPTLIRGFGNALKIDPLICGLILSNSLFLLSLHLLGAIVRQTISAGAAVKAQALFIVIPGSLFMHFPYTEALFFALVLLTVHGVENKNLVQIAICSVLLPMTKAIGVLCVAPVAYAMYNGSTFGGSYSSIRGGEGKDWALRRWSSILVVVVAYAVGYWLYCQFMKESTGRWNDGYSKQSIWGGGFVLAVRNLLNVTEFIWSFANPSCAHCFRGSAVDRLLFIPGILLLPVIWRLGRPLTVWHIVLGILPAVISTFTSYLRMQAVDFPLMMAFGACFASAGASRNVMYRSSLAVCAVVHVCMVWRHVNFFWAG